MQKLPNNIAAWQTVGCYQDILKFISNCKQTRKYYHCMLTSIYIIDAPCRQIAVCPILINILVLAKSRPFPKLGHKSGGPDSRKRVIVGRSFLTRCGDYKRRISSAK